MTEVGRLEAEAIRVERDRLIVEHGPWVGFNIHLGHNVYTMGHTHVGTGALLVRAVTQAVADLCGRSLSDLRVLDLACAEGAYGIELGLHGASVVGIEGRPANVAKATFAAKTLGLSNVTFELGDVRTISIETLGKFDVVLCLGILYHLEADDAVRLIEQCFELTSRLTVIRTAIGLAPNFDGTFGGHRYRGRRYTENIRQQLASLDNPGSILPTRSSLLNLLADVGFSSVYEIRNPFVPGLDDLIDSVTIAAIRGERQPFPLLPGTEQDMAMLRRPERRRPAWMHAVAHPQQGRYWKLRERLTGDVSDIVWRSQRPMKEWLPRKP